MEQFLESTTSLFDIPAFFMYNIHCISNTDADKIDVQDLQGGFERKGVVGKEKSYRD